MIEQLLLTATVIGTFVTLLFLISIPLKRNDIADVAWGTGIFLVALTSYLSSSAPTLLFTTILVLAGLWGGRLTLRILLRNLKKGEDHRYKKWRDEWGRWFYLRSFLQVYLLQGFLMIVVGYPFIHLAVYGSDAVLSTLAVIGMIVWIIGYFFEVVGDWQLDRFLADGANKGKIMQSGLWRYSRHPNYFGEITMWWGIWLMIAPLPLSYLALIGPLTITFLITKVSGIPMLEKYFANNPEFIEYKKRTSVLIPLPPRRNS
jgi:steroid 5-alpha reductase family enzyme